MFHLTERDWNMNARDNLLKMARVENFSNNPELLNRYYKDFSSNFIVTPVKMREHLSHIQFSKFGPYPIILPK
jgi:hypothetical protein